MLVHPSMLLGHDALALGWTWLGVGLCWWGARRGPALSPLVVAFRLVCGELGDTTRRRKYREEPQPSNDTNPVSGATISYKKPSLLSLLPAPKTLYLCSVAFWTVSPHAIGR